MKKHVKQQRKEINSPLDSRNGICPSQPMAEVPAREAWLYNNPKALASVLEGLKQADEGRINKIDLKKRK